MKRLLIGAAVASLLASPVFAQSGGGVVAPSVPLTASCITQSVAQLCFDATNILSLRNGANAQALRIYNTTDGTNSEWLELSWLSSVANVGPNTSGTGSFRGLALNGNGIQFWTATTYGGLSHRWDITSAGNFQAQTDNTNDIGANGANRPRNEYLAGYIVTQVTTVASLATCNSGLKGARSFVTDANAATFLTAVAAGGANNVPVVCDGTSWKIG